MFLCAHGEKPASKGGKLTCSLETTAKLQFLAGTRPRRWEIHDYVIHGFLNREIAELDKRDEYARKVV